MNKKQARTACVAGASLLLVAGGAGVWWSGKHPLRNTADKGAPGKQGQGLAVLPGSVAAASATNGYSMMAGGLKKPVVRATASKQGASGQTAVQTADQKAAEKMRELLDSDKEEQALALARELMKSGDAGVRSEAIVVFGWIGVKALPELSALLSDQVGTVAEEAFQHWQNAVDEISDDTLKSQVLVAGMSAMSDQDSLESTVMAFDKLPEDMAVRSLVSLIQSENARAAGVAREHYEFVTSETYSTPQAAEAWIKANREAQTPAPAAPAVKK